MPTFRNPIDRLLMDRCKDEKGQCHQSRSAVASNRGPRNTPDQGTGHHMECEIADVKRQGIGPPEIEIGCKAERPQRAVLLVNRMSALVEYVASTALFVTYRALAY